MGECLDSEEHCDLIKYKNKVGETFGIADSRSYMAPYISLRPVVVYL
jgi:hypothetical protein